jgi:hypothetical protein
MSSEKMQRFISSLKEVYDCSDEDAQISVDITRKLLEDIRSAIGRAYALEPTSATLATIAAAILRSGVELTIEAADDCVGRKVFREELTPVVVKSVETIISERCEAQNG